ncbi:MAG: site-specific integrase, partial [Planctomycetales bacterium]|nr:site-specific integrase [Planctomycetales bacterium]
DRIIGEWLANGRRPAAPSSSSQLTISELLVRYWSFAQQHYRKNGEPTQELDNMKYAARALKKRYGRTVAADFGPLALKAIQQQLVDEGLSRNVVNHRVNRIKRMMRWAVSEEIVPATVVHALSTVQGLQRGRTKAHETEPVMPVDDVTLETTLAKMSRVLQGLVQFQRLTGGRPGEACIVRPRDIDRTGEVWIYRPESHKTEHHGRARQIAIGPRAQAVLRPFMLRHEDEYCFSPRDAAQECRDEATSNRKTPMSCGNRVGTNRKPKPTRQPGEHYTRASLINAIYRACDRANVPRWSPNRLRHAAATEIRHKFGLEASQVVLGHSAADVTQIYAERDMQLAAKVAREVG